MSTFPLSMMVVVASFVAVATIFAIRRKSRLDEREQFIRSYVFPSAVLEAAREKYPSLSESDSDIAAEALRRYFLVYARAGGRVVDMPSRVVDVLWHAFILDTRAYHAFCKRAFGTYFHHIPGLKTVVPQHFMAALQRTWRIACREEGIDPRAALRLPLLFAIDTLLMIPQGNHYKSYLRPFGPGSKASESASRDGTSGGCGGGCGGGGCGGGGG